MEFLSRTKLENFLSKNDPNFSKVLLSGDHSFNDVKLNNNVNKTF